MRTYTFRISGKVKSERPEPRVVDVVARSSFEADSRLRCAVFPHNVKMLSVEDYVSREEVHLCRSISAPKNKSYIKKTDL